MAFIAPVDLARRQRGPRHRRRCSGPGCCGRPRTPGCLPVPRPISGRHRRIFSERRPAQRTFSRSMSSAGFSSPRKTAGSRRWARNRGHLGHGRTPRLKGRHLPMRKNRLDTLTRSGIIFHLGVRHKARGGRIPTNALPSPATPLGLPQLRLPTGRRKSATRRVSP